MLICFVILDIFKVSVKQNMSYHKAVNDVDRRDNLIAFRASTEDRMRAEALKSLMQVSSTSAVFRTLLNEKAQQLGMS